MWRGLLLPPFAHRWVKRTSLTAAAKPRDTNMQSFVLVAHMVGACLAGRAEGTSGASYIKPASLEPEESCAVPRVGPAAATYEPSGSFFVSGTSTTLQIARDQSTLAHPCVGVPTTSQADMASGNSHSTKTSGDSRTKLNTAAFVSGIWTTLQPTDHTTRIAEARKGGTPQGDMTSSGPQSTELNMVAFAFVSRKRGATQVDMTSCGPQSTEVNTAGFISSRKRGATRVDMAASGPQSIKLNTAPTSMVNNFHALDTTC